MVVVASVASEQADVWSQKRVREEERWRGGGKGIRRGGADEEKENRGGRRRKRSRRGGEEKERIRGEREVEIRVEAEAISGGICNT